MADRDTQSRLRALPAISELLDAPAAQTWLEQWPRSTVVAALQAAVARARQNILTGRDGADEPALLAQAEHELARLGRHRLRRVLNATGIVLHTGLGRAPLAEAAIDAVADVAAGYSNLEVDLTTGSRGHRGQHAVELFRQLTGAEDVAIVNNNAAATLLVLNTLAEGREVIVSRGQLIEIGGAFRLPDIMAKSGAVLREVGTTNRTRLDDYAAAIGENTALLLSVHTSNYRVVGFTESVATAALVSLAAKHGLPVYDDLGSGAMFDLTTLGLPGEPHLRERLAVGADVLTFSGDKLFGGPQAGIIAGKKPILARLRRNPLMRAFRVDKLTLAALEATLQLYRDERTASSAVPALAMLAADPDCLRRRAETLRAKLMSILPAETFDVADDVSYAGGGSLPEKAFPTQVVRWQPTTRSPDQVAAALRTHEPAVVVRIHDDRVLFDVRTLRDDELDQLTIAVHAALMPHAPTSLEGV